MEAKIDIIRVYGKGCIGCQNHASDIMISYTTEEDKSDMKKINDLFLSQKQAEELLAELGSRVQQNKETE